jgi:hypothetical protein
MGKQVEENVSEKVILFVDIREVLMGESNGIGKEKMMV